MKYIVPLLLLAIYWSACSSSKDFNKGDVKSAAKLTGLEFEKTDIDTMYNYLLRNRRGYDSLRKYGVEYEVSPVLEFNPHPSGYEVPLESNRKKIKWDIPGNIPLPDPIEKVAFYTIAQQAALLRSGKITSVQLTQIYLERIKKHDPTLKAVVTLLEERALSKALTADEEMQHGRYRSILHGIPFGVKDIIALEGYKTTWGSEPYKNQELDYTATVIKKLEDAGAVLVAKLTSGALARGDVWFGGQTKNPWDTLQGASGSSAGSGSATSAGLVSFALGTETLGSITSPSTRNGISGLRPTYNVVSRSGVMTLSWSMDKVGPMGRSAEDCAMVFDIIRGSYEGDQSVKYHPFYYNSTANIRALKVGYFKDLVDKDTTVSGDNVRAAIEVIKNMGIKLKETKLPEGFPRAGYDIILRAEAGAFFDELVRSGDVDKMVQQTQRSRANSLRQSRFIPAVEYLQANRSRRILIEEMHQLMKDFDVIVTPTFGGNQLMFTNLTGHPVVTVPTGFDDKERPTSITFLGNLYDEATILQFAKAFQEATEFGEMHPPMFVPN